MLLSNHRMRRPLERTMVFGLEHVGKRKRGSRSARAAVVLTSLFTAGCYDLTLSPFADASSEEGVSVAWARAIGGPGDEWVVVDGFDAGDLALAGDFEGETTFGAGAATETVLDAGRHADGQLRSHGFVARYDPAGIPVWVSQIRADGLKQEIFVREVGADSATGAIVVAGEFHDRLVFGDGGPDPITLLTDGPTSFLARFDHDGSPVWAVQEPGLEPAALAIDPSSGRIVIGGAFSGTVMLDGGAGPTLIETTPGETQAFVAVYDPGGDLIWARQTMGDATITALDFASGDVLATGSFTGSVTWGPGEPSGVEVTAEGQDAFVAVMSLDGGADDGGALRHLEHLPSAAARALCGRVRWEGQHHCRWTLRRPCGARQPNPAGEGGRARHLRRPLPRGGGLPSIARMGTCRGRRGRRRLHGHGSR